MTIIGIVGITLSCLAITMMTIVYIMRYLDYKRKGKRDAIQNKTPE